jgi:hypothetical protein
MKLPAQALIQSSDRQSLEREARASGKTRWLWAREGDGATGRFKLMRTEPPRYFYRGQNKHYDPCWPSICRGFRENTYRVCDLDPLDRARLLRALALNEWFVAELSKHPMMQWAAAQQIVVDGAAIAQHYGVPTGYIDVSESIEVSAFFATCHFVPTTGRWEPMRDGTGVMYQIKADEVGDRLDQICYQPFPRPTRQWAWTVELLLGEDFLQAPGLVTIDFEHDPRVGEEFLRRFDGGTKLLPPDPTAQLAAAICAADELPIEHVEKAEAYFVDDQTGVNAEDVSETRHLLQDSLRYSFSDTSHVSYSKADIADAEAEWSVLRDKFFQGVGLQLTRTRGANEA